MCNNGFYNKFDGNEDRTEDEYGKHEDECGKHEDDCG
ncbi:hypothetical protein SAMN04488528_10221, partial [Clostridium frigidicarnis]